MVPIPPTITMIHHKSAFFTEEHLALLLGIAPVAALAIEICTLSDQQHHCLNEIAVLTQELDKLRSVQAVQESDFFKDLQQNAAKMRERHQRQQSEQPETTLPDENQDAL